MKNAIQLPSMLGERMVGNWIISDDRMIDDWGFPPFFEAQVVSVAAQAENFHL